MVPYHTVSTPREIAPNAAFGRRVSSPVGGAERGFVAHCSGDKSATITNTARLHLHQLQVGGPVRDLPLGGDAA